MNVQAPPNLAPEALALLARSGLNDWGGVSPLTIDWINPEAPWPKLRALAAATAASGQRQVERLPVYPEHLLGRPDFFDPAVRAAALRLADERGFRASAHPWEEAA
jgi:FO synthase